MDVGRLTLEDIRNFINLSSFTGSHLADAQIHPRGRSGRSDAERLGLHKLRKVAAV